MNPTPYPDCPAYWEFRSCGLLGSSRDCERPKLESIVIMLIASIVHVRFDKRGKCRRHVFWTMACLDWFSLEWHLANLSRLTTVFSIFEKYRRWRRNWMINGHLMVMSDEGNNDSILFTFGSKKTGLPFYQSLGTEWDNEEKGNINSNYICN